jgi:hypothetical protein
MGSVLPYLVWCSPTLLGTVYLVPVEGVGHLVPYLLPTTTTSWAAYPPPTLVMALRSTHLYLWDVVPGPRWCGAWHALSLVGGARDPSGGVRCYLVPCVSGTDGGNHHQHSGHHHHLGNVAGVGHWCGVVQQEV